MNGPHLRPEPAREPQRPHAGPTPQPRPTPAPAPTGTTPIARDAAALSCTTGAWSNRQPLSEARNAHHTNTKGDFERALKAGYNWFEGDVRTELNAPHALEMRHDEGQEPGDNMTLEEWLTRGKAAGRGLKLDVKEGARIGEILDTVERIGVPADRLMFNLGDTDMARWGPIIRQRFPEAYLAINPTDALGRLRNDGELEGWQIARMIALAERAGQPVTFVVRVDRLTDAAIRQLAPHGAISVWNSPGRGGVDDIGKATRELRLRGVDGVIDLRPSLDLLGKAGAALDKVKNRALDKLDEWF